MQNSLLRWGAVQFCLFRCNNAEFFVQMGNGSVCWDGERFSLVFFDITMTRFSVCVCVSMCVWKGNSLTFVILSK